MIGMLALILATWLALAVTALAICRAAAAGDHRRQGRP
jgi:hypothetical protein